eukprot:135191_1
MSTNEVSTKWINLLVSPTDYMASPTGTDRNNYIVIDREWLSKRINCIYKYNINTNKWNKISDLNNIHNISWFSAALDVKKHLLYLSNKDSVTQIQLNNGNMTYMSDYTTNNIETNYPSSTSTSIILNDSLFIIGGHDNKSIFKWNVENKTLTKFS